MSVGLDPAFLAAYQSPNYYQMQNIAPVDNTYVAPQVAPQNIAFTGNSQTKPKKESNGSTAGFILGTVLTVGAAALCRKAYKVGNPTKSFFSRIGDGFKNFWDSGKNAISKYTKPERFTVREINGQQVFTVPNRSNIMRTSVAESRLAEIGANSTAPQILDNTGKLAKGIKIRSGEGVLNGNGGQISYKFNKGKLTEIKLNDQDIMNSTDTAMLNIKKEIQENIKKHMKGENLDNITNLKFSHSENGISRLFTRAGAQDEASLTAAVSRYHNINSDAVQAYAADNPKVKTVLESLAKEEYTGLKIAKASYNEPTIGEFIIENGKIKGIVKDGTFYGTTTDKYKALYSKNKEAFDNVLKQEESKFSNIVRELA